MDEEHEVAVKSSVLSLCVPILHEFAWLSKDLNASHVVRAVVCVLAGVPIISERKGKGSKHPHSVSLSEPLDKLIHKNLFFIDSSVSFDVPEEFNGTEIHFAIVSDMNDSYMCSSVALVEAVTKLFELSVHELQSLAADPTSAAVLGVLERVLANPKIIAGK